MTPPQAAVFSVTISVGGTKIEHFANAVISYSADGYGARGLCSQQLTFDVPSCKWNGIVPYGTEVMISCGIMDFPSFYVSNLRPSSNSISFTCYDRTMFTSAVPVFEDSSFDDEGTIEISMLLDILSQTCGFDSIYSGEIIPLINSGRIRKNSIINKSVREILTLLTEIAYGCFVVKGNTLSFMQFACSGYSSGGEVKYHSRINYGMKKTCEAICITNGSEKYISGGVIEGWRTVKIQTEYADSALAGAVIGSLRGREYTAWSCDNALVKLYPAPGSEITFADGTVLVTNYCRFSFTRYGCIASMGRNNVPESEYQSQTQCALNERVKIGENNGQTKIDRDGIKFVYKNENEGATEEYDFRTFSGGITEFAGAVMDNVMPDAIESVSETVKKITYGSNVYTLSFDKDENGKKSNISLVKEES